jgi:hypothetical protein
MKKIVVLAMSCAGLMAGLILGPMPALAELEVSGSVVIHAKTDFEAPLAAHGVWVDVGTYGHCWHPRGVAVSWRPYCDGTWVWTDSGWYWQSDEPWAWACYHYGTWFYDSNYGWCWVPDVKWGPAWVDWRTSDVYVGWVPCGPPGFVVEPAFFVFVPCEHFHDRIRPNVVIVNNTTIINQTREIRTISRENRQIDGHTRSVVVNKGPQVDVIEKATRRTFKPVPIQEADRRTFDSIPRDVKDRPPGAERPPVTETHEPTEPVPAHPAPTTVEHNNVPERVIPERATGSPGPHNVEPQPQQPLHWWQWHPRQPKAPSKAAPAPAPAPHPVEPVQPQQAPQQPVHPENPPAQGPGGNGADHGHEHDRDH